MTPVEYRPAQRRFVLWICGVFGVWGVVAVGVCVFGGPGLLSWLGLAFVDEEGIRVWRPVGHHPAPAPGHRAPLSTPS
ncbi:hypothetical protein ACFC7A_21580 [Streptomyces niveus]|uniref:hypothetical protein n=1 Tax=Streptomyces niveus TaxID=193462 RepID=UPI0035DA3A81